MVQAANHTTRQSRRRKRASFHFYKRVTKTYKQEVEPKGTCHSVSIEVCKRESNKKGTGKSLPARKRESENATLKKASITSS